MTDFTITFQPDNISIKVEEGTTIAKAAQDAGVFINNLCGGEGVCGQCRVQVTGGKIDTDDQSRAFFSKEELAKGYTLACQTEVHDDLDVLVPPESRIEGAQIMTGESDRSSATGAAGSEERPSGPLVRKVYVELPEPTLEDNMADVERLFRGIRKILGWHQYEITLPCLRKLSEKLRQNDWKVTVSLAREIERYRIIDIEHGDTSMEPCYGLAVDVGTTTVVAQLLDLGKQQVLDVDGTHNMQASYGEDVISRMIFACGKGGLDPQHAAVIRNINQLIRNLTSRNGIAPEAIRAIVAAGNTTMSHFLLGLTPCSIRLEPYVPTAYIYPQISAREVGLNTHENAILETIPSVASYVGGDIVAGVLASGIADSEAVRGLIDIGTNGEIAIGNKDWLVCCSASAGPAFEGGGTRCGMRATKGAIEKVQILDGAVQYQTIGNSAPRGICGSGLIDIIYELVKNRIITPDGKFHRKLSDPRLTFVDDIPQYTIAERDETETGDILVITESDIDNLMKSKGAVFAAIKALMDYIGMPFDQLESLYVAGGFGSFLNIPKAVAIGLLPDIDREKIQFIGNSSLTGARMCLLSEAAMEKSMTISRSMTNIELSNYQPFMDEYIASLFLPHTDRRLFPSVDY